MSPPKATFYKQKTEGVSYYRCYMPARYLPGKVVEISEHSLQERDGEIIIPEQEGRGSIWSFPGNLTRARMMSLLQDRGHKVLVEVDDNYMIGPPVRSVSTWETHITTPDSVELHTYEMHVAIAEDAHGIIVSTPRLAEEYSSVNSNVTVCPNCVDPDDWDQTPPHQEDGILRVGWAASDSHMYDAGLIREALGWASKQERVEVVIMGIRPEFSRFAFKHTYVPWTDSLEAYRKALPAIDLMLCPVLPGRWNECKSDIKALEAAMAGAAPVVSHVEPFRPWFDLTHSFKSQNQCLRIVKHLVRNRDIVSDLAEKAKRYALDNRDIRQHIHKWDEAINGYDSKSLLHRAASLSVSKR